MKSLDVSLSPNVYCFSQLYPYNYLKLRFPFNRGEELFQLGSGSYSQGIAPLEDGLAELDDCFYRFHFNLIKQHDPSTNLH